MAANDTKATQETRDGLPYLCLGKKVRALRSTAVWRGEVVAISEGPACLLETEDGHRILLPVADTTFDLQP